MSESEDTTPFYRDVLASMRDSVLWALGRKSIAPIGFGHIGCATLVLGCFGWMWFLLIPAILAILFVP